eukprot:5888-Pelagococcus_subviridis.AAC.1
MNRFRRHMTSRLPASPPRGLLPCRTASKRSMCDASSKKHAARSSSSGALASRALTGHAHKTSKTSAHVERATFGAFADCPGSRSERKLRFPAACSRTHHSFAWRKSSPPVGRPSVTARARAGASRLTGGRCARGGTPRRVPPPRPGPDAVVSAVDRGGGRIVDATLSKSAATSGASVPRGSASGRRLYSPLFAFRLALLCAFVRARGLPSSAPLSSTGTTTGEPKALSSSSARGRSTASARVLTAARASLRAAAAPAAATPAAATPAAATPAAATQAATTQASVAAAGPRSSEKAAAAAPRSSATAAPRPSAAAAPGPSAATAPRPSAEATPRSSTAAVPRPSDPGGASAVVEEDRSLPAAAEGGIVRGGPRLVRPSRPPERLRRGPDLHPLERSRLGPELRPHDPPGSAPPSHRGRGQHGARPLCPSPSL